MDLRTRTLTPTVGIGSVIIVCGCSTRMAVTPTSVWTIDNSQKSRHVSSDLQPVRQCRYITLHDSTFYHAQQESSSDGDFRPLGDGSLMATVPPPTDISASEMPPDCRMMFCTKKCAACWMETFSFADTSYLRMRWRHQNSARQQEAREAGCRTPERPMMGCSVPPSTLPRPQHHFRRGGRSNPSVPSSRFSVGLKGFWIFAYHPENRSSSLISAICLAVQLL